MKKLMLLGGISYLLPVIKTAHELGCHVITVDYLPDNIAHKYSDEYVNVSIIDKEAVLKVAKEKQIDGIMSFGVDPGVVSAAYVAEQLGLPFQCSYKSACILQDKSLFRRFLAENGFNCPKAKGYNDIETAISEAEHFTWPVIVKPVDSAGSKGVAKVIDKSLLESAIKNALKSSMSKKFIIEDYLDVVGYQSSADVFVVDGKLVYPCYSDQMFDVSAANPFTPAIEIWPSTMPESIQEELTAELQRFFKLLNVKSGLFNVESRLCSNGKSYIMEVSPRGGGNRIAELQHLATGQDLIKNEIFQALGMKLDKLERPVFNGIWCNYILHSSKNGILKTIEFEESFCSKYIKQKSLSVKNGDKIEPFSGANNSLGTIFIKTETRQEMNDVLENIDKNIKIVVE